MNKKVIILPTYNEKNNISLIIRDIFSVLPEVNILVVDDNSPDGTAEIVKKSMLQYPHLSILERFSRTGLGDAYKDAIKRVITDKNIETIITMDADGSHQPKYLKDFLENINGYDLVIGSRYVSGGGVENWEPWRRLLSKFGNLYARTLTGMKIKDLTAGFMCIRRELLEKVNFDEINSAGYAYLLEFKFYCVNKLGARVKEVPIIFTERRKGESKMSQSIIIEGIKAPLKIFIKRLFFVNFIKNRQWLILITILFFVVVFSISHLTTRPSLWFDEGLNIEIAHNLLLFGKLDISIAPNVFSGVPYLVGTNGYPLIAPLAGVFSIFGFGIEQVRIYMLFWLIFVLLSIYHVVKSFFGVNKALAIIAFVATFAPFYGNGLSVVGEVPGFFFLIWGLFFLIRPERPSYLLVGLLFALAGVTKPSIYLLLFPTFLIFILLEERRGFFKHFFKFIVGAFFPFLLWIVLAFPNPLSVKTWEEVFLFYRYQYGKEFSIIAHILKNSGLIFTHSTLIYFLLLISIIIFWFFVNGRTNLVKRKLCVFFFIYGVFSFLYFLKSPGWLRYIFGFEILAFIFVPLSIETISKEIFKEEKFQNLAFKLTLALLLIIQLFHLFFFRSDLYSPYPEITASFINENLAKNNAFMVGFLNEPVLAGLINPLKKFHIVMVGGPSPILGENPFSFPKKSLPQFIVFEDESNFIKGYERVLKENYFSLKKIERFNIYELK